MRRINYIVFAVLLVVAATSTSFAQTSPRIFGAGELKVDDGNGNNVYLSTKTGSLGIDNSGNVIPGAQTFPSNCALLDLSSTTKGFLPPRMTTFQETSICGGTPNEGLVVYNTTTHTLDVYNGSSWAPVGGGWQLTGNTLAVGGGTMAGQNFIGTLNAQDFVVATNVGTYPTVGGAGERIRVTSGGNVGISPNGLPFAPAALFHVGGTAGVSDVRFSSLSGSPLLAPPLVPANDGITIAGLNGDLLKYDISTVVGAVAWLRTGNTISDGNNKLGTLNDVAIDIRTFNTTRVTIGNSAASNAVTVTGNEQVNGNLSNTGNATIATTGGTNNTFGNGGGATTNAIGTGANLNQVGNSAVNNQFGNNATSNNFGNVAGSNQFGENAGSNEFGVSNTAASVTNAIGTNTNTGNVTNNIGNRAGAGTVTTNIGTVGTSTINIGSTGAGGNVAISASNGHPITIDVANTANNLTLNNILQDNTTTNLLMLTGASSGNARTRTLGSLLTGSQGVEVSLIGSTLDAHFASTNLLSPFTSTRYINLAGNALNITTNGGANNMVVLDGGGAAVSSMTINNFAGGNGLKINGIGTTNNGINIDMTANGGTGIVGTGTGIGANFTISNSVGVGFPQGGIFTATNTGTGSARALTATASGAVVGAGGVDGIVASGTNSTGNLSRGIAAGGSNTGGGPTMGGQFTATGSGAGLATGINVTAGGSTSSNIAGDFGAAGANSIGVRVSGATTSLQTDNNNILGDGAGNDNTTVNISGTGNLTLNGIAQDNTTVSLLTTTGVGSPANGNVRYRQLSSLIAANQGLFLIPGVTPTVVLGSNLGGGDAANPLTVATRSVSLNGNTLQFLDGNGGGNVVMSVAGAGDVVNIDNASVGTVNIANGGGASTVTMGTGASQVKIGQSGAFNTFGPVASTNLFGDVATQNFFGTDAVQNWLGLSNAASNVVNQIGNNNNTGTVTNNIGIQGGPGAVVTNISNSGPGTVNIGNTGAGGNVSIAASNGHPITIDVANTANNLNLNNIAQDLTQLNFLMLTGANLGSVRTRTLSSLLTGSNGVEVTLVGSALDAHLAPANNLVLFTNDRFINTNANTLHITSGNPGTNDLITAGGTTVTINNSVAGTTNIGNVAAATNTIGVGANSNNFGSSATTNNIGNTAGTNNIGSRTIGAGTTTNNIGAALVAGGTAITNIGQPVAGATATTNIGQIAGGGSAINILGVTSINTSFSAATSIGNTVAGGPVSIASGGVNPITVDVGNTGNNLILNNIAGDATPTQMLTLNGTNDVRVTTLSGTALEGIVFTTGAYRLGSTIAGNGVGSNPLLVDRHVNLDNHILDFTVGNNTSQLLTLDAGTTTVTATGSAVNVNQAGTGNTAIGNATGNVAVLGAPVNINNSGSGITNINRSGTGQTNIGNTTGGTTVSGRVTLNAATPINASGSDGANNQVLRSMGAGATPQWFTLQTDNATLILSDGVTTPFAINLAHANTWTGAQTFGNGGGTTTTIDPSGGGNFVLNNIANDNTTVNLLTLTGAGSGNVRYRTLSTLLTGSQGVDVALVAGTLDAHFAGTSALSPFSSTRYINLAGNVLNFTTNGGANNMAVLDGTGGGGSTALTVTPFGGSTNGINVNMSGATGNTTGVNATVNSTGNSPIGASFTATNNGGVGFPQGVNISSTNNGSGSARAMTVSAAGNVSGAGGVDGIVLSASNSTGNTVRGIVVGSTNSGGGQSEGGQFIGTGSGGGAAYGLVSTANGSTGINVGLLASASGANSIGVDINTAVISLRTDNNNILGDGAGNDNTTINISGTGNLTLNGIATDNTQTNLLVSTGAPNGNVRIRTLASLINADQGTQLALIAGVPTVLLGGNTNATNPLTSTRFVNVNNQLLNFTNAGGANNLMQMDGPNSRVYVNSNAPYVGPSVMQVAGDENPVNLDAHQLLVTGKSNSNLMLELGYNTTAVNATIQSYNQGTGATPLLVQPMGGLTTVGGGGATQQLVVNGTADAVVGNTLAGNPAVWDLVVKGDQVTTGIAKFGGSLWIDGVSATHQIRTDAPLRISTSVGNITVTPQTGNAYFDANLFPNAPTNYSLGSNALRWTGIWGTSLDVTTSVNAGSTITAGTDITSTNGNISATNGNVTAPNGVMTAKGDITTTTGNFVATAGGVTAQTGITSNAGNITATAGTVTAGAGFIANAGGANITGRVTLAGASSPLRTGGTDGNVGDLLTSAGTGNSPTWQSPAAAGLVNACGGATVNTIAMFTAATTICNSPLTVVGTAVTGSGSITATSTLTAGTGITATTGNINAAAGQVNANQSISAGTSITAGGLITTTGGNITAPAGTITANGTITSTTGNLVASGGGVQAKTDITTSTGNVIATAGNITASAGSVSAFTTVTAGTDITSTGGNINATAGAIRTAGVDRISNNGTVNATGIRGGFVSSAAAPYAVVATDYFVKLTAGSNGATLPVSAAANAGRIVVIRNISGGAVSITAGGSTIDGAAPVANNLGNGVTVTYVSDGAGDWVSY